MVVAGAIVLCLILQEFNSDIFICGLHVHFYILVSSRQHKIHKKNDAYFNFMCNKILIISVSILEPVQIKVALNWQWNLYVDVVAACVCAMSLLITGKI